MFHGLKNIDQKIILASTSPRRADLLRQIGFTFDITPSDYIEDMTLKVSNKKLARILAYGKAQDVANKVDSGIIIGVDTFIVCDSLRLCKPKDNNDAKYILKKISNKKLHVISGVAVIDIKNKKTIIDHEITYVYIKKLTNNEIDWYISTGEPLDKAGAFGIQGIGAFMVKKIDGCYNNVVGLPLYKLCTMLFKILKV